MPRPADVLTEERVGRAGDDGHLAAQVRRAGLETPVRGVHHAHRVLDRDELLAAVLATSRSVRPRHGRSSASSPWTRCERLSFVATWTVSGTAAQRRLGELGVGGRRDEVAARGRRTRRSGRRAWRGSCRRCQSRARAAGSKPNSSRSVSRNASGIFSQMPIVRSPCTLL